MNEVSPEEGAVHVARLAEVCQRLGSPAGQAETMARQLWKRSGQIAVERGIERTEALDYLLRLTISGVQGEPPPHSAPEKG